MAPTNMAKNNQRTLVAQLKGVIQQCGATVYYAIPQNAQHF